MLFSKKNLIMINSLRKIKKFYNNKQYYFSLFIKILMNKILVY